MSLIDTTDNILMLGAYGWAFVKPVRKLYYNMTITMRVGRCRAGRRRHRGSGTAGRRSSVSPERAWDIVRKLNDNFGALGYFIIGIFALSWIVSFAIYKWQRLDDLELGASTSYPFE